MTFEDLNINTALLNALKDLDFVDPTPIQKEAFSVIMSGKDVVGIAQTGTGKTFAYLLPLLRMWKFNKDAAPTIAIVVPTRELVVQVEEEVNKLSKYMAVRTVGVYGGANINNQAKEIYKGLDIIIGTPGRFMDLALNGVLKLKKINKFVIDEVDEMLNLGFRVQLQNIFHLLPEKRQNIMFSATLSEEVEKLIEDNFENFEKIEVAKSGTPIEKIKMSVYKVRNFHTKINLLNHLLETDTTMEKLLVFVSTKKLADKAFELLSPNFVEQSAVIHSNKSQNARFAAVNAFTDGSCKILIATDIIARGLDIHGVTHVINIDTPEVPEDYIHRIGRTGRAEAQGVAITMTTHQEEEYLYNIEELMQKEIEILPFPNEVEESSLFIDEEKETFFQKNYFKETTLKHSQGAFHEKLDKNKKVNAGGFAKKRAENMKTMSKKKYRNTR
jgi:ATP-dependent RNA helicase RhlE